MKFSNHYRILYAENNEDARFMVTVMLEFENLEVTPVETIAEAWQFAQREQFDLYLLDSRFPDGSGLDLCRRLRGFAPRTPIIIYSGDAFEADKQRGFTAGANAYLTKPYLDDLAEIVRETIEHTKKPSRKVNQTFVESSVRICQS